MVKIKKPFFMTPIFFMCLHEQLIYESRCFISVFQQMHKSQVDVTLLQRKVNAIINCFINSYLPPPLQIDIPQEMADQIIENKNEASPYLFREAQVITV